MESSNVSRNNNSNLNIVPNKEDNFYGSTNNVTNNSSILNFDLSNEHEDVELNNSILKLANQVRKNIKSAKEDFENFIRQTDDLAKKLTSSQFRKKNMTISETETGDANIEISSSA